MVELNKSEAVSLFHAKIDGVPQFVSYFKPVHWALLSFDGQATGRQVYDFIAEHEGLTDEDKAQVNQNGRPTFENRAAWSRLHLMAHNKTMPTLCLNRTGANGFQRTRRLTLTQGTSRRKKTPVSPKKSRISHRSLCTVSLIFWTKAGPLAEGFVKKIYGLRQCFSS